MFTRHMILWVLCGHARTSAESIRLTHVLPVDPLSLQDLANSVERADAIKLAHAPLPLVAPAISLWPNHLAHSVRQRVGEVAYVTPPISVEERAFALYRVSYPLALVSASIFPGVFASAIFLAAEETTLER